MLPQSAPLEEHIARHDFEATTGVRAGEVEDTPRSASPHTTEASLPGVQIVIELCLNNDAVEGSISVAVNSLEDVPKTYDSDTEPDLDAIVASLAADTDPPDVPMPEVGQTATTDSAMKCEPSEQVMPKMEHQVPLEVKMSASSRAPDVVPAGSLEQHIDRPPSKSEDSVPGKWSPSAGCGGPGWSGRTNRPESGCCGRSRKTSVLTT